LKEKKIWLRGPHTYRIYSIPLRSELIHSAA
jgi:hypothetical protein